MALDTAIVLEKTTSHKICIVSEKKSTRESTLYSTSFLLFIMHD